MDLFKGNSRAALFSGRIALWLWFTVLFANFAEAIVQGRGKAGRIIKKRQRCLATIRTPAGKVESVSSGTLKKGDIVIVVAGEIVPADGTVIEEDCSI